MRACIVHIGESATCGHYRALLAVGDDEVFALVVMAVKHFFLGDLMWSLVPLVMFYFLFLVRDALSSH